MDDEEEEEENLVRMHDRQTLARILKGKSEAEEYTRQAIAVGMKERDDEENGKRVGNLTKRAGSR